MNRTALCLTLALILVFGGSAFAGGGHEKCGKNTQECLTAMAAKYAQHGWLGIETEKEDGAQIIKAVVSGSPAEAAGFRAGDVLIALNGVSLAEENWAQLKEIKKGLAVGSQVTYTVKRSGTKEKLTATLGKVPQEVLAQWIGQHMLEHHVEGVVAQVN